MQENITDVALELADYVKANRSAGKSGSTDLDAAIIRLCDAGGYSMEDALVSMSYAQLFLANMVNQAAQEGDDDSLAEVVLCFAHKAMCMLENATGKSALEYI